MIHRYLRASLWALARAVHALPELPQHVFVDGRDKIDAPCDCDAVIGGDGIVVSIAAASIIAKVTRDRLMSALAQDCPGYGFEQHKGYAVPEHLEALARLSAAGIRISVASNQSGVGPGLMSPADLARVHARMTDHMLGHTLDIVEALGGEHVAVEFGVQIERVVRRTQREAEVVHGEHVLQQLGGGIVADAASLPDIVE